MLTELRLTNFRIFDDEVTVRFRPITIFIGRNSSGKSSVIKFLLMLQQSITSTGSQFLVPEGDLVRLGHFSALKNSRPGNRKRNLTFELTATSPIPFVNPDVFDLSSNIEPSNRRYKINAALSYSSRATIGHVNYSLTDSSTGKRIFGHRIKILDDSNFLSGPDIPEIELTTSGPDRETLKSLSHFSMTLELVGTLRNQIHSIRHLSPVRDESQRVILASPPPSDYVGQRGQYALPHLQHMSSEDLSNYEFIHPYLEDIAGIEGVNFKTSSGYLSQAFARSKTTKADVLIADYGFGVSQCIPVLVQGAIMAPHTSLMVEQPEAQLHPTAQLELGSFFARLWADRQVGSIIETHSDNVLLRLRRLIAKGELSHDDVSVAFFTVDEQSKAPVIKNLNINADGSMEPGLPLEFFGADVMEGLNLGSRT